MSGDSRVIGDSELGHTSPTGVATVDPDFENEGPSQPLTIYDLNLETEPIPLYQEFPNISGGRTTEEARPSTTERTATSAEAQNCHHTLLLKVCCVLLGESLGGAIGISIAETILLSRLKVIDPELAANGNILSLSKSFDGVQLERASSALSQAITRTFLVCTAAAGLPWALGMLWLLVLGVRRILRKCLEAWKRRGEVKTTKSSSSGPELRRRSAAVGPEIRKLRREPLLEIT
jgi:hypothetical protein